MNKKLQQQIIEMAGIDQELRLKAKPGRELMNFVIYAIDGIHNYRIRKMIEQYGYPTQKMVGKRAIKKFWLLIQHQDYDEELQQNCLKYCDFEPKEKAYLTDRILVNQHKKQIYGTQFYFDKKTKKLKPKPIEEPKNLDKRRRSVGMEPFRKYQNTMKKVEKSKFKTK